MADEIIKKLTGSDTRTAGERASALISRAISPDKGQMRSIEDSPTKMAQNRALTQKRLDEEKKTP